MNIQMVDLHGQYLKIKDEVDASIQEVINTTTFINGPKVKEFASHLSEYCEVPYTIPCGNGTDALQIALMALELKPGDEVIVPAFTYVASAEVIGLLGLIPVMVDVDYESFNITAANIEKALSSKTKAIIPVHLFGQSCDMEPIMALAEKYNLYVIEDNAQALGAIYTYADGTQRHTGTIGHIGCTSFFPSKNLGCYGDGGAMFTNDKELAERIQMIANHGQQIKYHHKVIGCNSRLDTLQAAILDVKLKYLNEYCQARKNAGDYYSKRLSEVKGLTVPTQTPNSTHVFHQYTLKVQDGRRNELQKFLSEANIPSMIYYPLPLQQQEAFKNITRTAEELKNAEILASSVLSLPIHTEITQIEQDYIISRIKEFFK
jgi:Predicted pyridoxal phosphate-dependent enzyme apparently involved in regulation of cell wall biogenesis